MEVSQRELVARDGTRIGYQMRGRKAGERQARSSAAGGAEVGEGGPAIVLANGLGSSHIAFGPLLAGLSGYTTLCWDYRGMFSSAKPATEDANTVAHQV